MNSHTEDYCWDKWGKCEYAHQVYDENMQFITSAPGHDAFSSIPASASDTSSPLEQILQKLNALSSTSSQPTAFIAHIGNPTFVATQSPSFSRVTDSGAISHMFDINSHNRCPVKIILSWLRGLLVL